MADDSEAPTLLPPAPAAQLSGEDDTVAGVSQHMPPLRDGNALRRGDMIGRYVIVDFLGAGGMGAVYGAYDPELERKVAIKVMLGSGRMDEPERMRLVREAQALARLQHPNVVAVYDAGQHDGRVFVAMEFVRGCTLNKWRSMRPRPWRELVRVFAEAGHGLAAAHAEGLVHRDFKPDNVMIDLVDSRDDDEQQVAGRVRVMDFGLARVQSEAPTLDGGASSSALSMELTEAGSVMGTPAYMAPEQFAAKQVDARTDQFSFCVALHEALVGRRPFSGASISELATNVIEGRREPLPARSDVPAHLRRLLARGLSAEPSHRFPSMTALLEALAYDPRRRNRVLAAGLGLVLVAGGLGGKSWLDHARAASECEAQGAVIEAAWSGEKAEALRAAVASTGVAYAHATADHVVAGLDPYAEHWRALRTQSCVAATIEHSVDDDLRLRTEACLDERRAALAELVAQLSGREPELVEIAVMAVAKLDTVESCGDAGWLLRQPPVPADRREESLELRRDLARVSALISVGKYEPAMTEVRAVEAEAKTLGDAALHARARLVKGHLHELRGELEPALAELVEAEAEAGAVGADDVAASSARMLVHVAHRASDAPTGLQWGRRATMWLDRLGAPADDLRRADLANHLGNVHHAMGDIEAAGEHYRRALDIRRAVLGEKHPSVAASLHNLAGFSYSRKAYDDAIRYSEEALAIWETTLGLEHPDVAGTISNLGAIHLAVGHVDEGTSQLRRALELREKTLGPDHVDVATTLHNLGRAELDAGDVDGARRTLERALAIRRSKLPSDHPHLLSTLELIARSSAP